MKKEELENIFSYHTSLPNQPARYKELYAKATELALLINGACPESREKSLAITNLQQTIMWANAAIVLNEKANPLV